MKPAFRDTGGIDPMGNLDKCVQCGRPESEHHEFDPGERPAGCVCDWSSWGNKRLPAICGAFVTDGREDNYCRTCHHDEECHWHR